MTSAPDVAHATAAPPARPPRLLGEFALLYGSVYVFAFFKFVAGLLVAKLLGPGLYGLRTAFGLATDYETQAQLGTYEAMQKEVPRERGRGNRQAADTILSNVLTANLLQSAVVCALLLAAALYLRSTALEPIYADFLIFLGGYSVISRLAVFYTTLLIVDKRTNVLSQYRMLHAALSAALSVGLVYYLSLRGLFVGLFLAQAASLAFLVWRIAWLPKLQISLPQVWELLRIGFPIMLITLLFMLFRSVDRLLVLGMLSTEMLGYFAIGVIISAIVFESVADVFRVMFFPRLMERVGAGGSIDELRRWLLEPTILVAYLTPFLIGAAYLAVHLPFVHFAPEYLPAVDVARLLVLAQFFFVVVTVPLLVCVALNRQHAVVVLTALAIALNAALTYGFIRAGLGIEGVALGTGASYAAYSIAVTALALRELDQGWRELFRLYARVLVPFIYAVALLLIGERWLPWQPSGLAADLGVTMLKIALFCALYAPLLLVLRAHPAVERLAALLPHLGRAAAREEAGRP